MKGRELKKWRAEHFLSQTALASILKVNPTTVANWETGRTRMPGAVPVALEAIAQERASLVRHLRAARELNAHRRRLKAIDQEQRPEVYAQWRANAAKARARKNP